MVASRVPLGHRLSSDALDEPFNLIGGDQYRKYTIDWHTGGIDLGDGKKSEGRVDFYVDDVYLVCCFHRHAPARDEVRQIVVISFGTLAWMKVGPHWIPARFRCDVLFPVPLWVFMS